MVFLLLVPLANVLVTPTETTHCSLMGHDPVEKLLVFGSNNFLIIFLHQEDMSSLRELPCPEMLCEVPRTLET